MISTSTSSTRVYQQSSRDSLASNLTSLGHTNDKNTNNKNTNTTHKIWAWKLEALVDFNTIYVLANSHHTHITLTSHSHHTHITLTSHSHCMHATHTKPHKHGHEHCALHGHRSGIQAEATAFSARTTECCSPPRRGKHIRKCGGKCRARPCLLYTSPSPRDRQKSRMPSSA